MDGLDPNWLPYLAIREFKMGVPFCALRMVGFPKDFGDFFPPSDALRVVSSPGN